MAACVAGIAGAVEVNGASMHMSGSLLKGNTDGDITIFTLDDKPQQDGDALVFDVSTEKSGAHFQFWYKYTGSDAVVQARSVSLWFKPIDQVKVSVGDVGQYLYTERLHWWKDIVGVGVKDAIGWSNRYGNYTGLETKGVNVDVTPISGLTVSAGFGMGSDWATIKDGDFTMAKWGVTAKYQIMDNISAGIGYRDDGTDAMKIITAGVDFGNYSTPYYAFIMPRFLLQYARATETYGLDGIGIDNYFSYSFGSIKVEARFPVILRLTDDDSDPSYMFFDVKASYGLGAYTPYIEISNDDGSVYYPIIFNDELADCFGISVKPGVTFNVGKVAFDAAVEVYITGDHNFGDKEADYGKRAFNFAVPVSMDISF